MSMPTGTAQRFRPPRVDFANFKPQHFVWRLDGKVATITLNRPERKNPLTLESYAELRDTFRDLVFADAVKSVVITGAGENSALAATCTRSSVRWWRWRGGTTCPASSRSPA